AARAHRQHRLGGRRRGLGRRSRVHRVQARRGGALAAARHPARRPGHHRQRHRSRRRADRASRQYRAHPRRRRAGDARGWRRRGRHQGHHAGRAPRHRRGDRGLRRVPRRRGRLVRHRTHTRRRWRMDGSMIKRFHSLYVGQIELENIGLSGTPADARRYTNARFAEVFWTAKDIAQEMDALGYYALWTAEHHFQHEGYECFPNLIQLSLWLATQTRRLKLGCAFNVLPMWHPVRLAEDYAMADIVTDGRVIMGVGRGYHSREVESFGAPVIDQAANRELFEAHVELMLKCFNEESFSHDGNDYAVRYKWFAPFGFVRYADEQGRTWRSPGAPARTPSLADGIAQKAWFCGPPGHVIDGIKSIEAKYPGLEDFMIHWAEGLSTKEFKEQLRWFARDVMPALTHREGGSRG